MPAPTTSPLTAAEIARTETKSFDFQVRFYVGGQRGYIPEGDIWSRDWEDSHSGITDFTVSSTLNGAIVFDDTSLTLADSTGFLAASTTAPRTVFIAPNDENYAWERVTYTGISTNDLTGLRRRGVIYPATAYSHPDGAAVYQWVDVTDRIIPDFTVAWFRRGNIATWNIPLTGVAYQRELFDRGNSFIIQARFDVTNTGSWTDWIVWFAGYIQDTPRVGYDRHDANLFQINVGSLASYLYEAPAHHIGKHDIAKNKPTVTSSVLINPALEASGEYIPASSVDGSRAVDDDVSTPWVSQGAPIANDNSIDALDPQRHAYISEVYVGLDVYGQQNIWVEIHNPHDDALSTLKWKLTNKQTVYDDNPPSHETQPGTFVSPVDYYISIPDVDIPGHGFLVMCRNLNSFEQFWSLVEEESLGPYDWRKTGIVPHRSDITFDRAADILQLRADLAVPNTIIDEVCWGGDSIDAYPTTTPQGHSIGAHLFTGAPVESGGIPDNHSIRRIGNATGGGGYTSTNKDDWTLESVPSPGTWRSYHYGEYISVDVGVVPTVLERELLTTDTTAYVANDTIAFPNTGSVVIGTDVLAYSAKDAETFTITDAPSQDWPEGTPVLPYINGSANVYYPVNVFGWERPIGTPFPMDFEVWASIDYAPRYPVKPADQQPWESLDESWKNDWDKIAEGRFGSTGLYKWSYMANRTLYYQHYMFIVREMSDQGRVKIGELSVIADASTHTDSDDNNHNLDGSRVTHVVKHLLVDHFAMDEDKFTYPDSIEDTLVIIHNLDLQKGNIWQTIDSLMRLTGYYLIDNPAFAARVRLDPLFPYGAADAVQYDFDRDSIESPASVSLPNHRQVSQIELHARNLSSGDTYTVYWPPTPNTYGEKRKVDSLMLGGDAHARAFAVNLFRRTNFGSTIVFRPTGICEWVTPATLITVAWSQDNEENPFLQKRPYVVTGVQWTVSASDPTRKLWYCEVAGEELVGY